jgi:hypothetical protein
VIIEKITGCFFSLHLLGFDGLELFNDAGIAK